MPESPHQAAIATPQGQVLESQQPAAVGSINSSNDAWDDNDAPF
jgi:hypothetical protein